MSFDNITIIFTYNDCNIKDKYNLPDLQIAMDKVKIAFVHPDLGIGGAERLVVDAALGLQERGHDVVIYTSHCDPTHCFEEVKNGSLKVVVYGDHLPTQLAGKLYIFFANLRQLYLIMRLHLSGRLNDKQLFIVDQLSTCLPLLRLLTTAQVMFYCHFPDQLLAQRGSLLKKVYRVPFDLLEQVSIFAANIVVVNSKFTKSIYHKTFKFLNDSPSVIYPCVDLTPSDIKLSDKNLLKYLLNDNDERLYLSINRFERKKNILLALQSFAKSTEGTAEAKSKLFVCGGYDQRVSENVRYLKELQQEAKNLKLSYYTLHYPELPEDVTKIENINSCRVVFITSISSSFKDYLLQNCQLLLYTPSFEHFGIVPLEAMKYGVPVLAVNNGGPLETVVSYKKNINEKEATGWLRPPTASDWASAINECKSILETNRVDFSENGPRRIKMLFSRSAMTQSFENIMDRIVWQESKVSMLGTVIIGIVNFLLHTILRSIFGNNMIVYIAMAMLTYLMIRNMIFSGYWIFAALVTYMN